MFDSRYKKDGRGVRHRIRESSTSYLPEPYGITQRDRKYLLPTPTPHLITLLSFFIGLALIIIILEKKLPTPLTLHDAPHHPDRFIAGRAMNKLIKLTSLGPRPTGSYENEVLAVNLFESEIESIMKNAKKVHKISFHNQKPSGAFPLHFLDGMTNVYRNVQNVIVKIGPHRDPKHSLLVNCHFDTVSDSPGGSDDGASCAIMLEILLVISQSDKPLTNNVIFLFNGAEENLMQASHGFITQHEWAKEVRAFINLEACGAGGKEILFQAGPNHPWIMQIYSEVVPYPYASSLAQEIFQSGVIPGDTDFRIFRDFGNVSGLDFAWLNNGYVYHTKFDNVDQIPLGTLQRTGDNILALTLGLTNSKEISNTAKYSRGNLVFFDFLGGCVFRWSEHASMIINFCAVAISIYSSILNMAAAVSGGMNKDTYIKQLWYSICVVLVTWISTIVVCILIALTLTTLNRTMSWFARPAWIFFLYICPSMFIPMALVYVGSLKQKPVVRSAWTLFQLYYDAYQLIWTALLVFCTAFCIRSGFIALLWTIFPSVGSLLRTYLFGHWKGWCLCSKKCSTFDCIIHSWKELTVHDICNRVCTDWKWLIFHGSVVLLPFAQCFHLILGAMGLYVPIMGRTGAGNNSEIIVAVLTSTMFILLMTYLVPLILLARQPNRIMNLLLGVFLIAMGVLILTPLGFPYSGDPLAPAPQRFMLAHTQRVYYNEKGRERDRQTGYWVVDLDQNSPSTVKSFVPGMIHARTVENDCSEELYCGLPYLMPVLTFIWKTHWIPGPAPYIPIPTTLDYAQRRDGDSINMTFTVTGPDHIGIMISPFHGIEMERWSLVPGEPLAGPKWNGRDTYFVYYSCASDPVPWTFWILLKGTSKESQILDIAVTSHFLHGEHQTSVKFREFLTEFPPWTATTAWTATYSSWKF